MSESHPIQRVQRGVPGGAIMTPQGPAVIQVIDMGGGAILPYGGGGAGGTPRKSGGINIFGALMRRWWLVLLVTMVIGGAGMFAANNLVKPQYEAKTMLSYHDPNSTSYARGPIYDIAHRATLVLTSRNIPLLAMKSPDMQAMLPQVVRGRDLSDPATEMDIIAYFKGVVDYDEVPGSEIIEIYADQATPEAAVKIANAFGSAFIEYCKSEVDSQNKDVKNVLETEVQDDDLRLASLQTAIGKLKTANNFEANEAMSSAKIQQIAKLTEDETRANLDYAVAEANLKAVTDANGTRKRRPQQELEAMTLVQDEMSKDSILKAYEEAEMKAIEDRDAVRVGKTDQHPDVVVANIHVQGAQRNVQQRKDEIKSIIDAKIQKRFDLTDASDLDKAKETMDKAAGEVKMLQAQLDSLGSDARQLAVAKQQLDDLNERRAEIADRRKTEQATLDDMIHAIAVGGAKGSFNIEEYATQAKLKEDKRIKVQAGGMVGGLFLGILLALLVDRFDKRLRDPRELEPMLGAPLLGSIPRIQELKRIKGEQARNLIAEEFRIIRTQVLFGNPDVQHKIIAVTSPSPGDGKTSLAVNLAISIAKAGRRVLLIDGDLRKPDIHRVFNVPDSPGFAELIAASSEPGAVIRKSDIDGLDVLPAGTPITRPSELLSRPDMSNLLAALGELYDHIILDTAPLLPVSDTHVLVGMVDAVLVSFNASVERDIVIMTHEILRRSHANVIGSVMNQVPYKQTSSYHRGKTAYGSYYNSPRGGPGATAGPATSNGAVATLTRT